MSTPKTNRYQWPEFRFDRPVTSGPLTVFPIVGSNGSEGGARPESGADYVLLSTAVEKGIATVTERSRSGQVPVIVIENKGKLPLLGIQGEEYVGSKQNRTLNISVLAPHGRTEVPVTCVEQGRWDRGAGKFVVGAYEPVEMRTMKTEQINFTRRSVKDKIKRYFADQSAVWGAVHLSAARHGVQSPTGALHDVYTSEKVSKPIDEITAGIEVPPETLGAVSAIGGRIVAADIFETADVFDTIWPRILRSYAFSSLGEKHGVPPSAEAARSFVSRPNDIPWSATPSVGLGEDVRWEGQDVLATALVWGDRIVHAVMFVL
jgi:hypothetical protein